MRRRRTRPHPRPFSGPDWLIEIEPGQRWWWKARKGVLRVLRIEYGRPTRVLFVREWDGQAQRIDKVEFEEAFRRGEVRLTEKGE